MRTNVTLLTLLLLIFYRGLFAQVPVGDNCTSPKPVSVSCSTMPVLNNETTAGFSNDMNYWWGPYTSLSGNDVVYSVSYPAGTAYIVVSVTSVSKPFYLISTYNNCGTNSAYYYKYISAPVDNLTIPTYGSGPNYLWVDHGNSTDITYSLSFGVLSGCTYQYTPDTRGNWGFDNVCATPQTKNGLEVTYNGVPQKLPLTYTPLNTPGVVCGQVFLKNTTGVQGVKQLQYTFGPDLTNVSPTVTSMPGFYNSGTWNANQAGNKITWTFTDAAGFGYGDFNGVSQQCLSYNFCFNITPISNISANTNIEDTISPDSRGMGFSGYVCGTSCCPSPGTCSPGGSGSGSSGGNGSIAIGFSDPGVLPVQLVNFSGAYKSGKNELQWQTAAEVNSNYFEVERSDDSENFYAIGTVTAAGNSSGIKFYNYTDAVVTTTEALYYRLKQVDKDGTFKYSTVIAIQQHSNGSIRLYPNPAHTTLFAEGAEHIQRLVLTDAMGTSVTLEQKANGAYDLSSLTPGIYFVLIYCDNEVVTDKLAIE